MFKTSKRVAVAFALTAAMAMPAAAETWNIATGFAEDNFQTRNVYYFAEEVERLTDGDLKIRVHSGQSLYKQPEIKRAVASGQIQAGEILLSAYGNEDPLYEVDSIPFLASGYDNAHKLWMAQKPLLEKHLDKEGLVLLYSVAWPCTAIYSKKPINSLQDLQRMKMRAYNAATSRLAEHLAASPTTVQAVEVPQAFATGVIEAMITSPMTGKDTQAWDYVSYYTDTCAWHNKNFVIINKRVFNKLDEKKRKAVLEAARLAEERGWKESAAAGKQAVQTIADHGVKIIQPSEDLQKEFRAIGKKMAKDWAEAAGPEGQKIIEQVQK